MSNTENMENVDCENGDIKNHLFKRLVDMDTICEIYKCDNDNFVEVLIDYRNKYVIMEDRLKYIKEQLKEFNDLDTDTINRLLED